MKRYVCSIISSCILIFSSCVCGAAVQPPAPQPVWKVGDSWKVRTWLLRINLSDLSAKPEKGPPVDTTFEVRRLISTSAFEPPYLRSGPTRELYGNPVLPPGGYPCFEVEVTPSDSNSAFRDRHFLYFRQDTGNLIRIVDLLGKDEQSLNRMADDFSPTPNGPIIEGMRLGITAGMFTFPDFTQDPNFSCERRYGRAEEAKDIVTQTIAFRVVKAQDGSEHEECEVAIVVRRGNTEFKTIQKWRRGDPWWYEARQYENGELKGNEIVLLRETVSRR